MKLERETMRLLLKFLICWIAIYTVAISIYFVSHRQINSDHQDPGRSSPVHGHLLIGDNSRPGNHPPLEQTPATSVIILTYQRCGSSVFGSVFKSNPNFFYTYEPLDALYSHMYGTEMGWNVPSDIRSYKDGTPRSISENEKTNIVQMLDQLINCRTDSLPAEFFDHPIYQRLKPEHPSMFPFLRCLKTKKIKLDGCRQWRKRVEIYCGYRFGNMSEDRLLECNSRLTGIETGPHSAFSWISYFHQYRTCREEFLKKSHTCVPMLEKVCASKRSRVFKIVRSTMETLEPLLKIHPELRIIHLLRDPRGVALSRSVFESGRGIYSGNDSNTVGLEAELFCRDVVEDINSRMELEQRYPGRFYTVFYDDFAVDPQKHTDDIYRFLGTAVPPSTRSTIRRILTPNRKSNLTSKIIAEKWKTKIRHSENRDVIKACKGFFSLFDRKWDMYV